MTFIFLEMCRESNAISHIFREIIARRPIRTRVNCYIATLIFPPNLNFSRG